MKTCSKCKKEKELSEFYKHKRKKDGYSDYCKECDKEYCKKFRNENKEHLKQYKKKHYKDNIQDYKNNSLKNLYGVTIEEYNSMFDEINGICPGCGEQIFNTINSENPAVVDHNHKTGLVRGLLCGRCNSLLGFAKDNATTLENLTNYLRK